MRIIYNHLGMYKLRDEPQIGQLIQQAGNKAGGRVAKTCCQHSQGEEGGNTTTESNQATNKCNKYDDKGSKKQQYEEEKEGGGVVSSRGKDIGLAANEVAAAKGDLKTVA